MRKSLLPGILLLAAVAIGRAEATIEYVKVVKPNGGEVWCVGSTQTIQWTNVSSLNSKTVTIRLSRNGGGSWETLASNLTNTGSFTWVVTGPATTKALIEVAIKYSTSTTFKDVSDATFTIEEPVFSYAEETFNFPDAKTPFGLTLVVCKVGPHDPPAAQSYQYKYIYTLRNKDLDGKFPINYIFGFAVSNCRESFLALKPKKKDQSEDSTWSPNTWQPPQTDAIQWSTNASQAVQNGISPSKELLVFCVYTNRKPVLSTFFVNGLYFVDQSSYGNVRSQTFQYWTPGCPEGGGDEGGCVHEFKLAQVYPVNSHAVGPFGTMSCWKGKHAEPIPASKLAIPGVFCLATKSDGTFDWEAFISGFKGTNDDSCCEYPVVQYIDLLKVSPPSRKCPIFGGYKIYQAGTPQNVKGIRTWWPLAYTMPGTTFTLTLKGMCQDGKKKKPYKEVYKWTVVANPDTFNLLIDLFHTNSLGELEVPSIVGEDTYAALKKCAEKLKQAVDAFKAYPNDPYLKKAVCDAIMECEALIFINTLWLDHLDAPEQMTYPYYQAAPKRQLPGNLAIPDPNVQKGAGGSGGVIGIIDTEQNPVACKLIADLEWINNRYCDDQED